MYSSNLHFDINIYKINTIMRKRLICLLACLFSLGRLFAETNSLMFMNLIPIFPDRDNLKEVSKQYNLTLKKYENNEFEFTCDSLKNDYFEIINISYDYSETIETWLQVKTCKYYAYSLLGGFFNKEKNRVLYVDYKTDFFANCNYFDFTFYDKKSKLYSTLYIPNSDLELEDSVTIFLYYELDNEEE